MSWQDGKGGAEAAGEMEMDAGRAARGQRAREERKIRRELENKSLKKYTP